MTLNGHLNATTDPDKIKLWWTKWPYAMIGARVPASCLVLDVDPRNAGDLNVLTTLVGELPETLTVWSGRNDGGRHLYFRRPVGPLSQSGRALADTAPGAATTSTSYGESPLWH